MKKVPETFEAYIKSEGPQSIKETKEVKKVEVVKKSKPGIIVESGTKTKFTKKKEENIYSKILDKLNK